MHITSKFSLLFFIIILISCSFEKKEKDVRANLFQQKLTSLNQSYAETLKMQEGLRTSFLMKWGDKYWKLVNEQPNNELAPKAAEKAFEIYRSLKNPNLYEQKLNELSIHDRAISGVLPYWDWVLTKGYVEKLQEIIAQTENKHVQIAAHYHLAEWYTKFKYYKKATKQLNLLDLNYQVYSSNSKYGKGIEKMLGSLDKSSADKIFPSFKAKMLNGKPKTADDLQGNITFLYFYGSTCGSCIKMYPKITNLYKAHKEDGFNVIGFCLDWLVEYGFNTPKEYYSFASEYNITWPQAVKYDLWDKLGIQALSTGYLIDQKGKIVRISRSDKVTNAVERFEHASLEKAVVTLLKDL